MTPTKTRPKGDRDRRAEIITRLGDLRTLTERELDLAEMFRYSSRAAQDALLTLAQHAEGSAFGEEEKQAGAQ